MINQLRNLKNMLIHNSAWQNEVAKSTDLTSPPAESDVQARIHMYAGLEDHHTYPRIILKSLRWSTNANNGACLETSSQSMCVELKRDVPADNATALEQQYEEVCTAFRDIANELTNQSYGNGNHHGHDYLGACLVECGEVYFESPAEEEIGDPESGSHDPQLVWFCYMTVTPQDN